MRFTRFVRRIILLAALPLLLLAIPAASVATAEPPRRRHQHRVDPAGPPVAEHPGGGRLPVLVWRRVRQIVLHHVAYGTVSPYEQVPAGDYTVAMRAAGAVATSAAVISASVDVAAGHAYTVAGLGPESGLRLQVLDDQLTTPPGQALVRIIQASLKQSVVSVTWGSDQLQGSLKFGAVSSYQTLSAGTATLTVSGGGDNATASVPLAAGTVHTLVVLDGARGLEIDNLLDAAGSGVAPAGGAGTGLGGMAAARSVLAAAVAGRDRRRAGAGDGRRPAPARPPGGRRPGGSGRRQRVPAAVVADEQLPMSHAG